MSARDITRKLDELLQDDANFSTRSGLRFMTELVKDAFEFIDTEIDNRKTITTQQEDIVHRLEGVEKQLTEFLQMRKEEQKKADAERTFYRRAVIGGIITIVISEGARWLLMYLR